MVGDISQQASIMAISSKYISKPKNKLEWIIFISGLVWILLYLFRTISNHSILGEPFLQSVDRWTHLRPIEFVAHTSMVSCLIIEGVRKIRIYGFALKSSITLFSGIVLLLIPLIVSIFLTIWVPKMIDVTLKSPAMLAELESLLEKDDLDNKGKALLSSIIAREKYIAAGNITFSYDETGNRIKYIPSDQDREILNYLKEIRSVLPQFKIAAYIWVSVLLGSLVIGLKSSVETNKLIE
jgi:hypothetical protein